MSPIAKCQVPNACFSVSDLLLHVLSLKVKSMPGKRALLYPGRMPLSPECLCFLFCFHFCFPSLLDQYLPIERSETFSLFCSPCCWFSDSRGWGWAWRKERQSLYLTTKIILSPWHVQQPQREFDIWGDWVARVILIYLAIGTEGIGSSKWTAGVRMGQGFGGRNREHVKKKWLFINSERRAESKASERASLKTTLNCLQEDCTAWSGDRWPRWGGWWLSQLLKYSAPQISSPQTLMCLWITSGSC